MACGLQALFGLPAMGAAGGQGGDGRETDTMAVDTGLINKSDKELPGAGKAQTQWSPTVRREAPGPETSIEIKAPTTVGTRTSVPFRQVLPSYRRKAESAMNRQQIPKQHQKRVREYFESLQGGGGR